MNDPRKTVHLVEAVEENEIPEKQRWDFNTWLGVYFVWFGVFAALFAIFVPKKSTSVNTMIDGIIDIIWIVIVWHMVGLAIFGLFHKPIIAALNYGRALCIILYKLLIKSLKLLIRSIYGIPNALKNIEKWSRER